MPFARYGGDHAEIDKTYPASHGCARIPMWIAQTVYGDIAYGSAVYVYA